MKKEEKLKTLLNVNYNKLLAYLAGGLVFFFTLFQLLLEVKKYETIIPEPVTLLISFSLFCGVCLFTYAGYHNFKEIVDIENELKLTDFKSSNIFSFTRNRKKTISFLLKSMIILFILFSFFIFLYTNLNSFFGILQVIA